MLFFNKKGIEIIRSPGQTNTHCQAIISACFSPSVHFAFRKAWVKNGGTLTNTEIDFYKAHFFFCDGLADPWLSDLSSRLLIVRHPAWIAQCISEDFIMPVAEFTLDRRFNFQAIEAASVLARELVEVHTKLASFPAETPLQENVVDVAATSAEKQTSEKNSRKRALEADAFDRPRMVKRARIYAPEGPLRTPLKLKSSTSKRFLLRCTSFPIDEEIGTPCSLSPVEELQVVDRSFQRDEDTAPLSTILPQPNIVELQTYWEGRLDEKQSRTGNVLSLRIEDLLQAPASHARLFSIGGECLGKPFRVISDKKSARTCSPTDASKTLIETPCTFNTGSKLDREEDDRIRDSFIPSLKIRNWSKLRKARNRFPVLIDN